MATQHSLTGLSPREAVTDSLHRLLIGFDSNNQGLFESALVDDESIVLTSPNHPLGPLEIQGSDAVVGFLSRALKLVTTHVSSNVRVQLEDSGDKASLSCQVIAYHMRPEEALKVEDTSYTVGTLYSMDVVKDKTSGLWKTQKWTIEILWTTGDSAVAQV